MKIIDINQAIVSLKQDNALIAQTDTIIGLICLSSSSIAQQKIFDMKQRGTSTPLALLVNSLEMAERYADFDECAAKLFKTLQGKITLIVSIKPIYKNKLGLNGSIGIRYTNSHTLRELMNKLNEAICATSANIHGEPHATTLKEAHEIFHCEILETDILSPDQVNQDRFTQSEPDSQSENKVKNYLDHSVIQTQSTPSILLNLTQADIISVSRSSGADNEQILKTIVEITNDYNKTIEILN